MQQFGRLPKTDVTKKAGSGKLPSVPATDAFSPVTPHATGQLLIPLPGMPNVPSDKDQLVTSARMKALQVQEKQTVSPKSLSQALMTATRPPRRLTVIRAEKKRKKAALDPNAPTRHLSRRGRHIFILLVTLAIVGGTLATLAPLATGQNGFNIPSGLSALLHDAQNGLMSMAQQQNLAQQSNTTNLPPMTIPRSQLVTLAEQDATNAGIPATYFVRQINLESGFNPNAVSPTGAEGVAQFEPGTAAGLGINPFDPVQALQAAAQMMARYYKQYGDYGKALAAYNAGPATLQNAVNACGANWLSCMPAQTQHYVSTIMG